MIQILRCGNWEADPEMCGAECSVAYDPEDGRPGSWVQAVCEAGWHVVVNGRDWPEHQHAVPFCSLNCQLAVAARMGWLDDQPFLLAALEEGREQRIAEREEADRE